MKPMQYIRKYSTCKVRRVMKESRFSYAEAGRRLGISRQAMQFLCYHHGLLEAMRKGKKDMEKIRSVRIWNLLEDCHYCRKKAAEVMGISLAAFNSLLRKTGMRCRKWSMEECAVRGIHITQKEIEAIRNLKKEIEKDLDVPISILELMRALISFGKEHKDLITHTILQNRAKYLGYEQEERDK